MKALEVVQNSFSLIGLDPKLEPFHRTTLGILIFFFYGTIVQWIFLIYEAENTQERMESMYLFTALSGFFLSFASTVINKTELFSFINNFDESTNESK